MSADETALFDGVVPFVAIAEARSFRAAARRLGVTPSALSKSLARLEGELGVRLLHRTSRSVTLTTDGEAFLGRCRDAMDQLRAGREQATQAQRAPRGLLRVSLPLPLARLVVMPALPRLLNRHPALSVQALVTDRHVDLARENVDLAVRIGPAEDSRLVVRRLRLARFITVAAPAYLARHGTPRAPDDLARHNCLKFMPATGLAREWEFRSGPRGPGSPARVDGNLVADHGESLVAAAAAGLGIVQALDFMVGAELADGRLVEILRDHAAPGPPVAALFAPGRNVSPRVRAFLDFLLELLGPGPTRS